MEECPICLEPCGSDTLVTECCHKHFHTSCHAECMKVNHVCPLCRSIVVHIEPEPEPELVLVPIAYYYCSKLFWSMCCVTMIVVCVVGTLMFCMITRDSYPFYPRPVNGTT